MVVTTLQEALGHQCMLLLLQFCRRLNVALVVTFEDSGYLPCLGHVFPVSFGEQPNLVPRPICLQERRAAKLPWHRPVSSKLQLVISISLIIQEYNIHVIQILIILSCYCEKALWLAKWIKDVLPKKYIDESDLSLKGFAYFVVD